MREFLGALQVLPPDQREALVLVGASGLSYEEAAEVLGTRVGTVKSRVSRARARLEALLDGGEGFARDDEAVTQVDGAAAAGDVRVRILPDLRNGRGLSALPRGVEYQGLAPFVAVPEGRWKVACHLLTGA